MLVGINLKQPRKALTSTEIGKICEMDTLYRVAHLYLGNIEVLSAHSILYAHIKFLIEPRICILMPSRMRQSNEILICQPLC